MTIENTTRLVVYTGNGATTEFPYQFLIPDSDAVVVSLYDSSTNVLIEELDPANYTIDGLGDEEGGTVTYNPVGGPITSATKIVIERLQPYTQTLAIPNQSSFFPHEVERAFDRIVMQTQQLAEQMTRAIIVSPSVSAEDVQETIDSMLEIVVIKDELLQLPGIEERVVELRNETELARDAAVTASEAAGVDHWVDTYADAEAALSGYAEGDVVGVFVDETKNGATSYYRVESGALVKKLVRTPPTQTYDTKADAVAALPVLQEGQAVWVNDDESRNGDRVFYRVVGGLLNEEDNADEFTPSFSGASAVSVRTRLELVMRPEDYGAHVDNTDNTTNFSDAIAAATEEGVPVQFPSGTYHGLLTLQRNLRLRGANVGSSQGTIIQPPAGSTDPLISLPVGPVNNVVLEDLVLKGNPAATGQMAVYAYAQAQAEAPFDGGLWDTVFRRIRIEDFDGHCFWFRGGHTDFLLPNQFILMEQVTAVRADNATARCLLGTGQLGQLRVISSRFDGQTIGVGTNIELSREFSGGGGILSDGSAEGDNAPSDAMFIGVTTQNAEHGYYIDRARDVNISGWLENLYRAVTVKNSTHGVYVDKFHAANAASDGIGGGYFLKVENNSNAALGKGDIIGDIDKVTIGSTANRIDTTEPVLLGLGDGLTQGVVRQYSASGGVLSIAGNSFVAVNSETATPVHTIESGLLTGTDITIQAQGDLVLTSTGGNISLPAGVTLIILRVGETITLVRSDLGTEKFRVKSMGVQRRQSTAQPASGYWLAGEFCWKTDPSVSSGKILLGWTRLTTGSGHVSGTDWSPFYGTNL